MELDLRPMTEAERLYCCSQSQQIMAQTGCIGHLRADMDTDGNGFFSSWDDHMSRLKTQEFKDEFDEVIRTLRLESGVLANRTAVQKFCAAHPEAQIVSDRPDYGFRAGTAQYAYLIRLNPNKGDYNLYCYCYRRDWLDKHIQDAARGIRFIDSHYKEQFRIPDGGQIRIIYPDGETLTKRCRYIDNYHVEVGSGSCNLFHICEFAERMEANGAVVEPVEAMPDPHKESKQKDRSDAR